MSAASTVDATVYVSGKGNTAERALDSDISRYLLESLRSFRLTFTGTESAADFESGIGDTQSGYMRIEYDGGGMRALYKKDTVKILANGADTADCYVISAVNEYWTEFETHLDRYYDPDYGVAPETGKPVIYLYPESECEVEVRLDIKGVFTRVYPQCNDGWRVTAFSDGRIVCDGAQYPYLFWEGRLDVDWNTSKGFVVKGDEVEIFLRDALPRLGLSETETNDFIAYWQPRLVVNPINLICFQTGVYTDAAVLDVSPAPDTVIRVQMYCKPLAEPVEIEPQPLTAPERVGFTVVEWGGTLDD